MRSESNFDDSFYDCSNSNQEQHHVPVFSDVPNAAKDHSTECMGADAPSNSDEIRVRKDNKPQIAQQGIRLICKMQHTD